MADYGVNLEQLKMNREAIPWSERLKLSAGICEKLKSPTEKCTHDELILLELLLQDPHRFTQRKTIEQFLSISPETINNIDFVELKKKYFLADLLVQYCGGAAEGIALMQEIIEKNKVNKVVDYNIGQKINHDMRAVYNGIVGFCEILKSESSDKNLEYIRVIEDAAKKAGEYLNDMALYFSNDEKTENILLVKELTEADKRVREHFKRQNLNVSAVSCNINVDEGIWIKAVKSVGVAFYNLIKNAYESFAENPRSFKTGMIDISCRKLKDGYVELCIKDNGRSIASEEQLIIRTFLPVMSSKNGKCTTGFGLANADRILRQSKAFLHIDSKKDQGTVASVIFVETTSPRDNPTGLLEDKTHEKAFIKCKRPVNVLAVEDNVICKLLLGKIMEKMFEKTELNLKIAESFEAMCDVCDRGFIPDIAVIDLYLPGNDGFNCQRWLRQKFADQPVKYILSSAAVNSEIRASSTGFDAVLSKPVSVYEWRTCMQKQCRELNLIK